MTALSLYQLGSVIGAFFTGSVVTSIINWFREHKHLRESRKIDYLAKQLSLLYGPLSFYARQNECLSNLIARHNKAYDVAYIQPQWSEDKSTQESIHKECEIVIDVANKYSRLMHENNDKIAQLIEAHFWLADPEDTDVFQQFALNRLRNMTEFNDDGITIPHRFYREIGLAPFFENAFVDHLKRRCDAKTSFLGNSRKIIPTIAGRQDPTSSNQLNPSSTTTEKTPAI